MGGIPNTKNRRDPNGRDVVVPLEYSCPSSVEIKRSGFATGRIVTASQQAGDGYRERSVQYGPVLPVPNCSPQE